MDQTSSKTQLLRGDDLRQSGSSPTSVEHAEQELTGLVIAVINGIEPTDIGLELARVDVTDIASSEAPSIYVRTESDFDLAALRQVLSRAVASLQVQAPTPQPSERRAALAVGSLVVDLDGHRVRVDDEEVKLTRLEFRLLRHLCERPDIVFTRSVLLRHVWGASGCEHTRTVDTHVTRLRAKLKAAGRYIETVRGEGYRFQAGALSPALPNEDEPSAERGRPSHAV